MMTRSQQGFTLVSAIFVLIVLSALGAYMVNIAGTNRATSTAALQGTRAYQAARSGINWAVYRITSAADQTAARNACTGTVNGNSFSINAPGLNGFTVSTTCAFTPHDQQGTNNVTVYTIESIAQSGGAYGSLDFVQRRIEATISPP